MGLGRLQAWMLGLPTPVVYGSLALFISILHNVFLLYYVDTFVSVYKINKAAFWVGEVGQHWGGAGQVAGVGPTQSGAGAGQVAHCDSARKAGAGGVDDSSFSWPLSNESGTVLDIHIYDKIYSCIFISWINLPWMGGSLMGQWLVEWVLVEGLRGTKVCSQESWAHL